MNKLTLFICVFTSFVTHAIAGPLHDAVKEGDIAKVKQLIASGEDVNQNQRSLGSGVRLPDRASTDEIGAFDAGVECRHRGSAIKSAT